MANTYLSKNITPSNYNRRKFTLSAWVKKAEGVVGASPILGFHGSTDYTMIRVDASSGIEFICYQSSSVVARKQTNMKLRDFSGWYHVVVAVDTDNGTASNRNRIYVNGEEQTSFVIDTNASSGLDLINNNQTNFDIGSGVDQGGSRGYFSGILSHVHYCEGYQYSASDFGEYDANGVWKIIIEPSVTYGTNGFFILKDGNSVTDQSGNSNNFTVGGGTLTNTEDSPSNVFATFNALAKSSTGTATYSNGNTTVTTDDACLFGGMSTLGMTSGKYYAEAKRISQNSGTSDDGFRISFGVTNVTNHSTNAPPSTSGNYFIIGNGTVYNGGTDLGILGGSANISDNGVQQIALDLDNNRITWGFNGQWMDGSGNYNQSSPSNWVTITDPASTEAGYFFLTSDGSSGRGYTASWNFGNGYFGTTAVASAGTNASGIGIFEYDVPTGYTALSTKGLNL